jgi:hypothetical protein
MAGGQSVGRRRTHRRRCIAQTFHQDRRDAPIGKHRQRFHRACPQFVVAMARIKSQHLEGFRRAPRPEAFQRHLRSRRRGPRQQRGDQRLDRRRAAGFTQLLGRRHRGVVVGAAQIGA